MLRRPHAPGACPHDYTALNDTYEYAVSTYTIIKPEHFEKMKIYLYNHIYEESKKAGL